jgi:hypothetical protein
MLVAATTLTACAGRVSAPAAFAEKLSVRLARNVKVAVTVGCVAT